MRAMVLRHGQLGVEEIARPVPGPMQVLAKVRSCGICGSDLHRVDYPDEYIPRPDNIVMGHELVAEIVAAGPGAEAWVPGTRVVSSPNMPTPETASAYPRRVGPDGPPPINYFLAGRSQTIGYHPQFPGGFGEYVLLSAPLLVAVPDHVPDRVAATTEPCAVGLHAVRAAKLQPDEHALVMGAGPIGLMTLLWLKRDGVRHVTVSDFSLPRRQIAAGLGADLVLDPAVDDVAARVAAAAGPSPVVFDCVGAAGTLQQAMDAVATEGRVVVVGVCSTEDRGRPRVGILKHLTLQFVLGYTAAEIAEALAAIADGSIDPAPLITRTVSLDELPGALLGLNDRQDCKVLIEFSQSA